LLNKYNNKRDAAAVQIAVTSVRGTMRKVCGVMVIGKVAERKASACQPHDTSKTSR